MNHPMKLFAVVASLALLGEARAAIVYFQNQNIAIPNTYAGVSVDLETGLFSTSLDGLTGGDANFFLGGARVSNDADAAATIATWQPVRTGTGNTSAIKQLVAGSAVDASTEFYSTGFGASGQINSHLNGDPTDFVEGLPGYLGFSLVIDDPGNPGNPLTVYGWARVTLENNDAVGVLHEWAYENTGAAIQVAAIPEPRAALLAGPSLLLVLYRRRN
jgi:hypothetical protein